MRIGPLILRNNLVPAPVAGVTNRPFRQLCRELGVALAVSERVSAGPRLRHSRKAQRCMDHAGKPALIAVQIAGAAPHWLAVAARCNLDNGAEIIDISMGCPAKKVRNKLAGSVLLQTGVQQEAA